MAICLKKDKAQKFLKALKSGEADPSELTKMTSEGRRKFFKQFGSEENAKKINALFEKKVIQKNKLAGLKSWVKTVGGLTEPARRDIIKRIENLGEKITDAKLDNFIEDAVEDSLGIKVNQKEFEILSDLTSKLSKYKGVNTAKQLAEALDELKVEGKQKEVVEKIKQEVKDKAIVKEKERIAKLEKRQIESKSPVERSELQLEIDESIGKIREAHKRIKKLSQRIDISPKEKEKLQFAIDAMIDTRRNAGGMAYGEAKASLEMFEQELITKADKVVNYKGTGKIEKVQETGRLGLKVLNTSRSMLTMFDFLGSMGRQGYKLSAKHPIIWIKGGAKTLTTTVKALTSKGIDPIWGVKASIYSRKNFELYPERLAVGVREDAFPPSLLEKVPGLGRIPKAFEQGYTAGLYQMRADIMDVQIERALKSGIELSPEWLNATADMVNILTGRGRIKNEGAADIANAAFFSVRKMASDIQYLTDPVADIFRKDVPADVIKQKAYYLTSTVVQTGSILMLAKYTLGDKAEIELDTRSANFGTIKVGDVRIDVTGGMKSFITLAARLMTGEKKSSTKGTTSTLGKSYGDSTRLDLLTDFFSNKLAPSGNLAIQVLNGRTREGKPIIIEAIKDDPLVYAKWLAGQMALPMPTQSIINVVNEPNSYPLWAAVIGEQTGFSAANYPAEAPKDWTSQVKYDPKVSKELKQLYETVGEDRFKEINDEYNKRILDRVNEILTKPEYHSLDNEVKKELFTTLRGDVRDEVIEEMASDFKFKRAKSKTREEKYNNLLN